ncbi:hypothetical protein WS86_16520 [Burkholderia savannae]|nr:hypothetical protein WS86_16520 [Burkholderia savannae]
MRSRPRRPDRRRFVAGSRPRPLAPAGRGVRSRKAATVTAVAAARTKPPPPRVPERSRRA